MSRPCGVVKETYMQDMGFLQKKFHYVSLFIFLAVFFLLPLTGISFLPSFIMLIIVFAIPIMGLNLLTHAQLFSVMH
ncbi:MAG: hypothetical protein NXY59_00130 [Aigarchaeota archaeon]|nr:hypothetical protein [Candidatus Pelearchaeum maunauluense]